MSNITGNTIEVHGQVKDSQGMPVAGALIVIVSGSTPVPEIALLTAEQGEFVLWLPRGRFTLRAHGPHGGEGEAEIEVETRMARSAADLLITLRS